MKKPSGLKVIRAFDSVINTVIKIALIIVFLVGLYYIADGLYVYNNAKADKVHPYKPVEGTEELTKLSKDAIAWITIDNTRIDYPVMQGADNLEYVNKDPWGQYSLSGSIFLDSRNNKDFSDYYNLIYGHHMSDGYMFGALDSFRDTTFFEEHQTGTLYVGDNIYQYNIFAFVDTDANEDIIFNPEGSDPMPYIKQNAVNYREPKQGNLVVLSTCKTPASTRRYIVCGTISK